MENEGVSFHEKQRFAGVIIWLLVAETAAMAFLAWTLWFAGGEERRRLPAPVAAAVVLIPAAIVILLTVVRMETEVRGDGVYVRLFPFHLRFQRIGFDEVAEFFARKYRPLLEYGGWGIRYSLGSGKAYNVRGNGGLQIVFKNGRRLLIGSGRAEELEAAIRKAMS